MIAVLVIIGAFVVASAALVTAVMAGAPVRNQERLAVAWLVTFVLVVGVAG